MKNNRVKRKEGIPFQKEKLTLSQLRLTQLPQLGNLGHLSGNRPLCNLQTPAHHSPRLSRISRRPSHNFDDPNPWIPHPTIMFPIPEIAHPALERREVILFHHVPVGDDCRFPRYRGPFARGVEEGNVDVWV